MIIDCYLLSISETATTSKGQNLLENLKVTLNPASWTRTILTAKGNLLGGGTNNQIAYNPLDGGTAAATNPEGTSPTFSQLGNNGKVNVNTFATGISWAGLTYNLNIANAVEARSEVIGRPTLHAFKNSQAVFYSGDELVTGLVGTQTSTLVRYPLGTTLFVTVDDIKNDEVTLSISVEGSVNTDPKSNIQNSTLTIAKTRIDTKAKILLGETLMLGGIYTQVNEDNNSGVPGIKKVPLAQYFFSNEATLNKRTSIVVLMTPRSLDAVKFAVGRAMSRKEGEKVQELFVRHPDWYHSRPNLVKILNQIARDPIMYYEFRNSDVLPPHWGWEPSFDYKLDQILAFAYY
ncbi:hypothetical protein Bealeia1_00065 [Candidatus Bealeia paramacronuclearis]|uniref:Type II/III secretion system secretin-like domain-containing protein n=1 Tax=Candidatus Bealeia paramacronuclearis TaxID=1921001 RepID=A0ABZ2C036_9PROT|nr:hypothetical protein [Candidatus Bealeia paramacronuclearis]